MLTLFKLNNNYKGKFNTLATLQTNYPTAALADYAYINSSSSYWYWNSAVGISAWVNQQIAESAYLALSPSAKAAVPYIVGV